MGDTSSTNGVHSTPTCSVRMKRYARLPDEKRMGQDVSHCWHTSQSPIPNPTSGSVVFVSLCCFCAPEYMHIDILVPRNIPDEVVVAEQMKHGNLITLKKQPTVGPRIAVPGQ